VIRVNRPVLVAIAAVMFCPALVGCGKKGPPLAPLRLLPERVPEFVARRLGSDVHVKLTVPSKNQDGSTPADLARVEVYAFTADPRFEERSPISPLELVKTATLLASVEVRPPPVPEAEEESDGNEGTQPVPGSPSPEPPEDPRPAQGAVVTLTEAITPELQVPIVRASETRDEPRIEPGPPVVFPIYPVRSEPSLTRTYVSVGVSVHNQRGALSVRREVPLSPPPPPPEKAAASHTADAIALRWTPPSGGPRRIQEPAAAGVLRSEPVFGELAPLAFNVYEVSADGSPIGDGVTPLNRAPIGGASFNDPRLAMGVERCYIVRSVQRMGTAQIESEASARACVIPIDTFPPAAPSGLTAVGSEGAISLIWEASASIDIAGYLVLRGEAPGETLQALTPASIRETTFRDTAVRPGVRYVYAVVAVDGAKPPNQSPESNRVEESAR
jgi:hypothetical protein